jgi:hypothetical protein
MFHAWMVYGLTELILGTGCAVSLVSTRDKKRYFGTGTMFPYTPDAHDPCRPSSSATTQPCQHANTFFDFDTRRSSDQKYPEERVSSWCVLVLFRFYLPYADYVKTFQ